MTASQRQEARVAKRFGGTVNSGSGNGPYRKNDVRTPDLSIELKTTAKASYPLKLSELLKAEQHALLDGRDVLFGIELGGRNWYVISEEDYLSLRELARGNQT